MQQLIFTYLPARSIGSFVRWVFIRFVTMTFIIIGSLLAFFVTQIDWNLALLLGWWLVFFSGSLIFLSIVILGIALFLLRTSSSQIMYKLNS
jgi:hypothetical protein